MPENRPRLTRLVDLSAEDASVESGPEKESASKLEVGRAFKDDVLAALTVEPAFCAACERDDHELCSQEPCECPCWKVRGFFGGL